MAGRFGTLPAWQLWLLPVLVLALIRLLLLSRFDSTHALVDNWFNHATCCVVFLLGAGFGAHPPLFARFEPLRWAALVTALLCWAGITLYFQAMRGAPAVPEGLRALQRVAHAALQWSAILAILGFARRHLNVDHRWRPPRNTGPLRPWLGLPRDVARGGRRCPAPACHRPATARGRC